MMKILRATYEIRMDKSNLSSFQNKKPILLFNYSLNPRSNLLSATPSSFVFKD